MTAPAGGKPGATVEAVKEDLEKIEEQADKLETAKPAEKSKGIVKIHEALAACIRRVDALEARGGDSDHKTEVALLRQEVAELRARLAPATGGAPAGTPAAGGVVPAGQKSWGAEVDEDFWGDA